MAKDEKKTITVNDVEYNLDDFTAEQSAMLNHIQDLDRKLSNAQFNLDQLMVGREAFVQRQWITVIPPSAKLRSVIGTDHVYVTAIMFSPILQQ